MDELLKSVTEAIQDQLNQDEKSQDTAAKLDEEQSYEIYSPIHEPPLQAELTILSVVVTENLFIS